MTIPYENLKRLNQPFEEDFRQCFNSVLESGHYILGGHLEKFEEAFARYHGAQHCVGVSNGLDAIILALRALELPIGSEVIVPSNTYIATILAVVACGLKPVLVEPDINTYTSDPNRIEAAINSNTRAMLIVHLYGKLCDMDAIMALKAKHNLFLVEDCAQAHGATYKGKLAGTFGEFGAFSFYPTKNLGALGDAGGIICDGSEHAHAVRRLRNYGSDRKYYNDVVGYNNRLDDMQAAFLGVKLKHLDRMNAHRNQLAKMYDEGLNDNFIKPVRHADYYDVFHIYNIRHERRDELQQFLSAKGIGTVIHYPVPPHRQKALENLYAGSEQPIADVIHNTTLSIPCSFCHTEAEISYVINSLNEF